MKNRFGFIPIVLPAIVMVLIIGLINLAGPQAAQAQGNVDDPDARLETLTVAPGELTPEFAPDVANYTVMVDNSVTSVTVTPGGDVVDDGGTNWTVATAATGASTVLTDLGVGVTTVTITITGTETGTNPDDEATYVIRLTRRAPDVRPTGPQLSNLVITGDAALTLAGKYGAPEFDSDVGSYMVSVDYAVQSVTVAPAATISGVTWTISPSSQNISTDPDADNDGTPDDHRVSLGVGSNEIVVNTKMTGGVGKYTVMITRQRPELTGITLGTVSADTTNHPDPAVTDDPDVTAFSGDRRTYNIVVDYAVDSTTVAGTVQADDTTPASRRITRVKSISPGDADGDTDAHDVNLPSARRRPLQLWLSKG